MVILSILDIVSLGRDLYLCLQPGLRGGDSLVSGGQALQLILLYWALNKSFLFILIVILMILEVLYANP